MDDWDRLAMALDASSKIAAYGQGMSRSQANSVMSGAGKENKPASGRSIEEIKQEEARVTREAEANKLPNGAYPKNLLKKLDALRDERLRNEAANRR